MNLQMLMFFILLVATFLMLFVAYLGLRKRQWDVAKYSALAMLAASFYSFGYAFEIISANPEQAKFWLKVQYIGIPFITTFWLILVILYTGHQALLKRGVKPLLFVVPLLTFILQYTNDAHHLFYKDMQFDPSQFHLSPTILTHGPWYGVHMAYLYLEAVAGMVLFVRMYLKAIPLVRKQVVALTLGSAAPWLTNILYLADFWELHVDLTPLGFTLSGFIYIWGIYRFNLLRLVPVAMQTVVETMSDGVVIVDYQDRITHVNEAAKRMFEPLNRWTGQSDAIQDAFGSQPELLSKLGADDSGEIRLTVMQAEERRYYHVKISVIRDKSLQALGKLLVFNDVTQVTIYQEQLLAHANQLSEFHAFKDKLFTVVTHDIRDPLALLVNLTEIMEEEFDVPEREEF